MATIKTQVIDNGLKISGSQYINAGIRVVWEGPDYYSFRPTENCRVSVNWEPFVFVRQGDTYIIKEDGAYVFDRDTLLEIGYSPEFIEYNDKSGLDELKAGNITSFVDSGTNTAWDIKTICDGYIDVDILDFSEVALVASLVNYSNSTNHTVNVKIYTAGVGYNRFYEEVFVLAKDATTQIQINTLKIGSIYTYTHLAATIENLDVTDEVRLYGGSRTGQLLAITERRL